jgi:hypothetical protein
MDARTRRPWRRLQSAAVAQTANPEFLTADDADLVDDLPARQLKRAARWNNPLTGLGCGRRGGDQREHRGGNCESCLNACPLD